MIVDRFAKYLNCIEYPKEKTSWNIAGILKDKNAFYKFEVKDVHVVSDNHVYAEGNINTKANKMVFELLDKWVILDIEEITPIIKLSKDKNFILEELLKKLEWTITLLK
jgi:hypothetical protein